MLASIISFAMAYGLLRNTIITIVLFINITTSLGYEKTLRKIVRNESKMVQRPFSDRDYGSMSQSVSWKNKSLRHQSDAIVEPGFSHITAKVHKAQVQRPKLTTILSSVDTNRGKTSHFKTFTTLNENSSIELRQPRHTNATQHYEKELVFVNNNTINDLNINREQLYKIPPSKFFPPVDDQELQSLEQKSNSKENTIIIPKIPKSYENVSTIVKGVFIGSLQDKKTSDDNKVKTEKPLTTTLADAGSDQDKADFLLQGAPVISDNFRYNWTINPYICSKLEETRTDIDCQRRFFEFDIEPYWAKRKHFWNSIYDSRYESLMRSLIWPPLKVILLPRTHVDSIWKKTFNQYHNDSVGKIISNVIKKLQFYSNLTFTWNEVSHLSMWWKYTTHKSRSILKRLIKSGRFEITTGGWVEPDESTTHLFGLVHLLVEGHEWLKYNLNYSPKVGWLTNTVTHSPTMTYLLSASDIWQLIITNLHYSWEQYLGEYQISDFVWTQNWDDDKCSNTELNKALKVMGKDCYSKHSVLTHYIPFNSAGFKACGPNSDICSNDFNFVNTKKNLDINSYNVKEKSELILEQYSKTGTLSSHNTVIAPLAGPYLYERQAEFDFQYNNYEKIADFINANRGIYKATIKFGTAKDYFDSILSEHRKYQTLKGDFLNFADVSSGAPAYWAGIFTSRPFLKIMLRRLESTLRTTELLFSFALNFNAYKNVNLSRHIEDMTSTRENFGRLLDRNVVSGTLPVYILRHVHNNILKTVNKCWEIQQMAVSLLTSKPEFKEPYLQKYVYREGEFISTFRTVSPNDEIYLFNSLSHERTEIVELITRQPNVIIMDHNKKEITVQINPVWKYSSDNIIKVSRRFYKINFVVVVPPMTLELFKIKETYDATHSASNIYCSSCVIDEFSGQGDSVFPFHIQPIQTGDIQIENYKLRMIFDEQTGFLKTVIEKETNIEKNIKIDFGAFKDANVNSGVFLFNTNVSKPLHDILLPYRIGRKTKNTLIVTGLILTEISSVYGRFLQHTVKIFNLQNSPLSSAIYLESKVDYEVSPKNRELELFMSIQTDISNGNSPEIITDNNGYQHTARVLNISRRIESNMYPITSMAFIQDRKSRLTYITDHAQGITALQEGQLIVMLDRRVLFNDGRGSNEGLADSSATCHRQYILLENFEKRSTSSHLDDILPSFTANYLSKTLNYILDIFLVDKKQTYLAHYSFLPLVKTTFPCDVSVLSYRSVLRENMYNIPNTALLILHRRSVTCSKHSTKEFTCNGDSTFSIDKIIPNVKAVYRTNLPGTSEGTPLLTYNLSNFPPMELLTLKIYF